jgi:hypothetical protein
MYETADSIMRNGVKYYNNFDAHSYLRMSPFDQLASFSAATEDDAVHRNLKARNADGRSMGPQRRRYQA